MRLVPQFIWCPLNANFVHDPQLYHVLSYLHTNKSYTFKGIQQICSMWTLLNILFDFHQKQIFFWTCIYYLLHSNKCYIFQFMALNLLNLGLVPHLNRCPSNTKFCFALNCTMCDISYIPINGIYFNIYAMLIVNFVNFNWMFINCQFCMTLNCYVSFISINPVYFDIFHLFHQYELCSTSETTRPVKGQPFWAPVNNTKKIIMFLFKKRRTSCERSFLYCFHEKIVFNFYLQSCPVFKKVNVKKKKKT